MSKNTKTTSLHYNLAIPKLKIIQSNFFENINQWNWRNVSSPFYYLWRNEQPGAHVEFDGRKIELNPEEVVLIPPGTAFSTGSSNKKFNQFYIHFFLPPKLLYLKKKVLILPAAGGNSHDFFQRVRQILHDETRWELFLYGILALQLAMIPESETTASTDDDTIPGRILDALEFMTNHINSFPENARIAAAVGMSKNNFMREFKRVMKVSAQHYLRRRRIENACDDLLLSQMTIDQIAEVGGFADRYHFSKVFKQLTGFTPIEYRRKSYR